MFQEFPKCLILGELARVVFDKDEEKAARADGFRFHDEKEEEKAVNVDPDGGNQTPIPVNENGEVIAITEGEPVAKKRPGRKPKAD